MLSTLGNAASWVGSQADKGIRLVGSYIPRTEYHGFKGKSRKEAIAELERLYPSAKFPYVGAEWPEKRGKEGENPTPDIDIYNRSDAMRLPGASAYTEGYLRRIRTNPKLRKQYERGREAAKRRYGILGPKFEVGPSPVTSHLPESMGQARFLWNVAKKIPKATYNLVTTPAATSALLDADKKDLYFWSNKKKKDINPALLELIHEAWRFAFNAYRPGMKVDKDFNYNYLIYNGENAGYIATRTLPSTNKEEIVFAFRGTQSSQDMLDDIQSTDKIEIKSFAGMELNIPIIGAYGPALRVQALDSQLTPTILRIIESPSSIKSILVTGHSLAGGSAEIFMAILVQLLPEECLKKTEFITFEGMRGLSTNTLAALLKTNAGKYMDKKGIRIYNDKDPVPSLPPADAGFSHYGTGWYLTGRLTDGFDSRYITGIADTVWDPQVGPHSMIPTSVILDKLYKAKHAEDLGDIAYVTRGRGHIQNKMRRKKPWQVKGSKAAKLHMAKVRAMKKT